MSDREVSNNSSSPPSVLTSNMESLIMNTLVTPIASPRAQEAAELTSSPNNFHRFMELPVEIRLLIYNEMMVQNVDLYRAECYFCQHRLRHCPYINSTYHANLACAQILRTSKQIYSETLPILYSKNTVHMKCMQCGKSKYQSLWICFLEKNYITTEPIEQFRPYVRYVAIAYKIGGLKPCDRITDFPACWPTMEHQILARYENTEHISLHIGLLYTSDITFDLVRRSCKSTTECVQDYKSVLAEHSAYLSEHEDTSLLAALEKTCDAVILSHAQGWLKDTAFAVQTIRWKPLPRDTKEVALYLGCDKHSASDTAIKQILAGPDLAEERAERGPFKAKTLMDMAGIRYPTHSSHALTGINGRV